MTYRMTLSCNDPFTALVGDCVIIDRRLDAPELLPGGDPFQQRLLGRLRADRFLARYAVPGYQYPMMYTIHADNSYYATWLNNQVAFLRDSQLACTQQVPETGPGCAAASGTAGDLSRLDSLTPG